MADFNPWISWQLDSVALGGVSPFSWASGNNAVSCVVEVFNPDGFKIFSNTSMDGYLYQPFSSLSTLGVYTAKITVYDASFPQQSAVAYDYLTVQEGVNLVTFPAYYGGGELVFATEPSGEGASVAFNWRVTITDTDPLLASSGQVYHKVYRNSGSIATGELGNTYAYNTLIPTGTTGQYEFKLTVLITDDTLSESNYQGESFTLKIFRDATLQDQLGEHDFTLYDADFDVSLDFPATQTLTSSNFLNISFTNNAGNAVGQLCRIRRVEDDLIFSAAPWSDSHSTVIPSANLPVNFGDTYSYVLEVYNGKHYWPATETFTVIRGEALVAPVHSGALVRDETENSAYGAISPYVHVNVSLSSYGSGGTFWVLRSYQDLGAEPPIGSGAWVGAGGSRYEFPERNPTWPQLRGTKVFYYARRLSSDGQTQVVSNRLTELVPLQPEIQSISLSGNVASINIQPLEFASSNPNLSGTVIDTPTTLYYRQSISPTLPVWQDVNNTGAPNASDWSTSNSFSVVPGNTYYYWVLGWTHGNPGQDGAAVSQRASFSVPGQELQGLEVYAANGAPLIEVSSRVPRSVARGTTDSVPHGGSTTVYVTGLTAGDDYHVFVSADSPPQNLNARFQDCTRHTGYFTVTNNMGVASSFSYIVIRTG